MLVTERATTGDVDAAGYDLTALGWLQFEQLCTELLALHGVSPEMWLGEADSARWATIPEAATAALAGRAAASPVVACVLWFPRSAVSNWDARDRVVEAIRGSEAVAAGTVLVLTNAIANADLRALVGEYVPAGVEVEALGRAELGHLIDAHRELWLTVPAVLACAGSTTWWERTRGSPPRLISMRPGRSLPRSLRPAHTGVAARSWRGTASRC